MHISTYVYAIHDKAKVCVCFRFLSSGYRRLRSSHRSVLVVRNSLTTRGILPRSILDPFRTILSCMEPFLLASWRHYIPKSASKPSSAEETQKFTSVFNRFLCQVANIRRHVCVALARELSKLPDETDFQRLFADSLWQQLL